METGDGRRTELVIYVVGPLRAPTDSERQRNVARAMLAAESLWSIGYVVICPHANSGDMIVDDPEGEDALVRGSRELVRRSDAVFLLPGWTGSRGSLDEVEVARERGLTFVADSSVPIWEVPRWMGNVMRIRALQGR